MYETIAIFVYKRNIETWIHYLERKIVNEEDTYAKLDKNEAASQNR